MGGHHADNTVFNGSEAQILLIDEQKTSGATEKDFGILRALRFEEFDKRIEPLGVSGNAVNFLAGFLDCGADAFLVKRFKDVVDRIDFKSLNGVLIKGGSEYDLRQRNL